MSRKQTNSSRPMRIGVIISYVAPYVRPVLERLAERSDCELFVVAETTMERDRHWQPEVDLPFPNCLLDSWTLDLARLAIGAEARTRFDTYLYVPKQPLHELRRFAPDVVVAAGSGIWSSPANIAALAARPWTGWAFVPYWGSFRRPRPTLPRRLAEPWVRRFMRSADAWLAYGSRSARDLVELGADPERVAISPLIPIPLPRNGNGALAGPPSVPACLYVGRLIERKGMDVLLEAFQELDNCELWVVGDGPLLGRVESLARMDPRIRMFGHIDHGQLASLYQQASVVVVPSLYEPWGLVLDEALEQGVPVVATDQVGAVYDLIDRDLNGVVVPAGSSRALAEGIRQVLGWTPAQRHAAAERSRAKLQPRSIESAVDGIVEACRAGIKRRRQLSGERR